MLDLGRTGELEFCTSAPLIDELGGVLNRAKFARRFAKNRPIAPAFLLRRYTLLATCGTFESIEHAVPTDADDDIVIATALAAGAKLIVSGDSDLLALQPFRGVRVLAPAAAVSLANAMQRIPMASDRHGRESFSKDVALGVHGLRATGELLGPALRARRAAGRRLGSGDGRGAERRPGRERRADLLGLDRVGGRIVPLAATGREPFGDATRTVPACARTHRPLARRPTDRRWERHRGVTPEGAPT